MYAKRVFSSWSSLVTAVGAAALLASTSIVADAQQPPSTAEMWETIKAQQAQINALKRGNGSNDVQDAETAAENGIDYGNGIAGAGWWNRTSVGGYGELHWNQGEKDQIDFHRFVLFVNHDFNDWIHFFSELEVEHALSGDGKPGEVELEQAWLRFDVHDNRFGAISSFMNYIDVGVMVLPVGIINEMHEPPTFYGVERNDVEKNIIPSTWWEAGVRIGTDSIGETGLGYELMYTSGLAVPTTGSNAFKVRKGRKKVANAPAENGAFLAHLQYRPTFLPGWEVASTYQYQEDIANSDTNGLDDVGATLWEVHTDIKQPAGEYVEFGFRALYARWDIDGVDAKAVGRDVQEGWYVEPSIKFLTENWGAVGFFYRHSTWDNEAGDNTDSEFTRTNLGMNYWPTENVVMKLDYQNDDHDDDTKNDDRLDVGMGLQF